MSNYPGRGVRIGVQLPPARADYAAIRRAVAEAEDIGVDIVFTWDHFFPLGRDADGLHFECWTVLGAWAEATSRVEIGALVSCVGYRNPDLLADMARTVDHISDGRLVLGLGAGFKERDFVEYGFEFGSPASRLDALDAAVPRIRRRWEALNPTPTRRIPVIIGGGGERRTLRIVAEHADVWHTFAEGDALAHKSEVLARHCADIGRDPAEIEHSVLVGGDPAETGAAMHALGVSLFVVIAPGPEYDLGDLRRWVAWRDAGRN